MFENRLESLSSLALKAAVWAADQVNSSQDVTRTTREKESPRDVVTDTDIQLETGIRKILADSEIPVIGEELSNSISVSDCLKGSAWIIDPIDGTANFSNGLPFYCHSIGLIMEQNLSAGAVANPMLGEVFFTIGNKGSYLNGKRLAATGCRLDESLIGVSFSGKKLTSDIRRREIELFGQLNDQSRGCLRTGSAALNICYAAAGRLQVSYGIGSKIWDVAGALAIAKMAGCKMFVEFTSSSETVNYAVGSPGSTENIAELLNSCNLAKLYENNLALY
jgi:myo-inositol-1(or 4)-monophosphatase